MGKRPDNYIPLWKRKKPPYQVGLDDFRWSDLVKDGMERIDPAIYRPFPYDLVRLFLDDKEIPGWWTGQAWEGRKIKKTDKVIFWKEVNGWRRE